MTSRDGFRTFCGSVVFFAQNYPQRSCLFRAVTRDRRPGDSQECL
jgi:hypothetical protein